MNKQKMLACSSIQSRTLGEHTKFVMKRIMHEIGRAHV